MLNKKILATLMAVSLLLLPQPVQANKWKDAVDTITKQRKILKHWQNQKSEKAAGSVDFQVHWDTEKGIPDFIQGFTSEEKVNTSQEAIDFVETNEALFKINGGNFKLINTLTDDYGMTHYRLVQEIDNIPIYGKELLVHTDSANHIYAINGDVQPGQHSVKWRSNVQLSADDSIAKAKTYLAIDTIDDHLVTTPDAKLYLYEYENDWYVVHLVTLQFNEPYPANYKIFVDAENGHIVDAYNAVADGHVVSSGIDSFGNTVNLNAYYQDGTYYLYDTTHPAIIETYTLNNVLYASLPGSRVTSSINSFNQTDHRVAVDTHSNLGKVYEFFKNNYGRNGFDNNNSNIKGSVHYYDSRSGKNNAFWNGSQMLFGDGDGQTFGSFGAALDVVAHEFTHAVTQYTANLEYKNQSGAINESISDVFGILCEGQETNWWLMGEDCYTPNKPGDALRNAKDPGSVDQPQPAHMDDYQNVSYDNGGVHINSGIPNRAFYLIANAIGFEDSGKIYYRALTTYLTSQSDFMALRNAVLQSASDIYGSSSQQYSTVQSAFSSVGLGAPSSSDTYESNDTAATAYGPLENGKSYSSYISTQTDIDIYKFQTPASGNITVALTDVAADYDLYLYNSAGTLIKSSENASTNNESISYTGNAGLYYIKVNGYNGAYSSSVPYTLQVNY